MDLLTKQFLDTLIETRKLYQLEEIIERFQNFIKLLNKEEDIRVISAKDLTKEEKEKLHKSLVKKYGHSNFQLTYDIDQSILGGL